MTDYTTTSGDSVPSDVADVFDPVDEWDSHGIDPDNVPQHTAVFGELYKGLVDGHLKYVSEWGNDMHVDHFDDVPQYPSAALPHGIEDRFTYDEYDVVHHDHYAEHVTRVIVVTETGRFSFGSRSGIVWGEYVRSDRDARLDDETLSLAMSLVDANNDIELPESIDTASTGWHSSLERSEQSEKINALSKGDVPPHWGDDVYPYAVVFEDTRNVCSQPISIYGNDTFRRQLKEEFDGAQSAPAFAGVN